MSDVEQDALLDSRCKGRIQIQTDFRAVSVIGSFLEFVPRHAAGRGMVTSLLDDGTLLLTFNVADRSTATEELVDDFARDVARILGRSEADIAEAAVIEMTDDRVRKELAALGIRQPDLRPV